MPGHNSNVTLGNPEGRPRPAGFSHAAIAGSVVTIAGQVPDGETVATGDFAAQFVSALDAVVEALDSVDAAPADLVHLRIYVTDLGAYTCAREALADPYRERLGGHYPPSTLVQVAGLLDGALVEIEALAVRGSAPRESGSAAASAAPAAADGAVATLRMRLAPSDARYAGGLIPGSKAMELFADLETELSLLEGGDEGLCVAYDMVEFHAPLYVGDFVEGTARVVSKGRTSRRIEAEIHKVLGSDEHGLAVTYDQPVLAARASATIVVGRTASQARG
jgi:enamine deaminase RidA (YjgF/YER057c/UK114 family)/acyl-CoA hydrolase